MPVGMILRRMWREWRLMGVLLLAICLVTGFLALGPLYVRAVSESGVRFSVENTAPERLNITLVNPTPLGADVFDLLNEGLGGVVTSITRITRSAGNLFGFVYTLAQPANVFTPTTPNRYVAVSYSNMEEVFALSEGRWPARLAPPAEVSGAGLSIEDQQARQVGVFSRGQVEAVITTTVAEEASIEIGARFHIGAEPARTTIVHIVGFIDPVLPPTDPFWGGQGIVLSGQIVPIGLFERFDFGLVIPEGAYDDWVAPVTDVNTYLWQMRTDPAVIRADTLDALADNLGRVGSGLRAIHPNSQIIEGISSEIIDDFREGIAETEGPIVLLSGAILVLMLYHLVTTVALVLEQQSSEWASIASRGGSAMQLVMMQLLSMGILGALGIVLGPFIGLIMLSALAGLGPLANVLGGASFDLGAIPSNAFVLSLVAGVASVIVLTLPAWPSARRSLLRLKQLISRPPTRPAWARYFLDFVFLFAGFALLLRLYFLIGGDLGQDLEALIQDPASLVRLIATEAGESGGLNDPFNLLGPALLLTGVALLWLRLFPLLMKLFARIFRNNNGLVMPLALWSVERDPGHYAQLVLLMIGTLALGTASLGLTTTRDVGAWSAAQDETGGYARVDLNTRQADPDQDWLTLPDVTDHTSLMTASMARTTGISLTHVFGVDPVAFDAAFPDLVDAVAPLADTVAPPLPGQTLPEDATALSVQVYAESSGDVPTTTSLNALLIDSLGVPFSLSLTTADGTDSGRFVTYTRTLPIDQGRLPWRLIGFQMTSRRGDLADFSHTVYLDDVTTSNVAGETVVVADFEAETLPGWNAAVSAGQGGPGRGAQMPNDLVLAITTDRAVSGSRSARIDYRVREVMGAMLEPQLTIDAVPTQAIPVVISESYALADRREYLRVGDEGMVTVELSTGNVVFSYQIVGIVETFPTMTGRDRFLIARTDTIRPALNRVSTLSEFYDWNQVWLELEEREPSEDLRFALAGTSGVVEAAYAWDRFSDIQREPLPNAITGMLLAGFWVSLGLSVLDFGFYLVVTARRRAISFAVLRAIGWEPRNIWGLLVTEQTTLIVPALLVGVALGSLLAYLLLPFLQFVGSAALRLPMLDVGLLLLALVGSFTVLLGAMALALQRINVSQVLRLGEE